MMLLVKMAWRNLWRNKRRSLITMASIFFAVILAVSMKSLKDGMYIKMIDNIAGTYMGYVQIHKDTYWEEKSLDKSFNPEEAYKFLSSNSEVDKFLPRIETFSLLSNEDRIKGAMIIGTDPELENQNFQTANKLIEGEYFNADDKALLIGKDLAKYLKLGVGDTVVIIGQGYRGSNAAGKYPIKGILKLGNPELSKSVIYLPLKEAQWLYDMESLVSTIAINLKDNKTSNEFAIKNRTSLGEDYEIMSWQELSPEMDQMIKGDQAEAVILMGILYLIISFGIFGTVLMMLSERRKEFGILVSIGMKRFKLAITIIIETVIIAIIGSLAGMIGAFPIAYYYYKNPISFASNEDFKKMYDEYGLEPVMQMSLDPSIFLNEAFTISIFALIIGLYPFFKILNFKPLNALRS